jgi:hypothetical protein
VRQVPQQKGKGDLRMAGRIRKDPEVSRPPLDRPDAGYTALSPARFRKFWKDRGDALTDRFQTVRDAFQMRFNPAVALWALVATTELA